MGGGGVDFWPPDRKKIVKNEKIKVVPNYNEKSALYKHKVLEHSNENVKYRMEITSISKDALTCQANESVRIQQQQKTLKL